MWGLRDICLEVALDGGEGQVVRLPRQRRARLDVRIITTAAARRGGAGALAGAVAAAGQAAPELLRRVAPASRMHAGRRALPCPALMLPQSEGQAVSGMNCPDNAKRLRHGPWRATAKCGSVCQRREVLGSQPPRCPARRAL